MRLKSDMSKNQREIIKLYRVKDLPRLELYQGQNVVRNSARHIHCFFSLACCEQGIRNDTYAGVNCSITPGSIVVYNIGEVHSGSTTDERGYSSRAVRVDEYFLRQLTLQITGKVQETIYFSQPIMQDQVLSKMIFELHTVLDQPTSKLEKECILLDTLFQLITRHAREKPKLAVLGNERTPIRQVRNYLHEYFEENVSLDKLAEIAELSPFHMARVFTKEVGVPPHVYQNQLRLKRAADLLALKKPIVDVAMETGFFDQSHFSRAFKKKFGVTPGQYARLK